MSSSRYINNIVRKMRRNIKKALSTNNRWKNVNQEGKYKKWRYSVMNLNKRQYGMNKKYVCQKCDKKYKTTRYLHAHHIFSWNKFPSKRYTISNGMVMCIKCHNKFHKKYKYDALSKPNLLVEYIEKHNKYISEYINKNKDKF